MICNVGHEICYQMFFFFFFFFFFNLGGWVGVIGCGSTLVCNKGCVDDWSALIRIPFWWSQVSNLNNPKFFIFLFCNIKWGLIGLNPSSCFEIDKN